MNRIGDHQRTDPRRATAAPAPAITTARWLAALTLLLAVAAPVLGEEPAAEEESRKWRDTAELTYLQTGGNSEATTLGFRNKLERIWPGAVLTLDAAGVRADDTTTTRSAVLLPDGMIQIDERSETVLTAESYALEGRYDREISKHLFWFVGTGWKRNEFAGINNRYYVTAGVGNLWFENETTGLRTHYGLTFTEEEDVVGIEDSFAGARLSYDYFRKLSGTTKLESKLTVDENLDDTSDVRADFTNSLAVSMSARLALKVSLQLLYDGRPALAELAVIDDLGQPTGGRTRVELDSLDSVFNVSLVVTF